MVIVFKTYIYWEKKDQNINECTKKLCFKCDLTHHPLNNNKIRRDTSTIVLQNKNLNFLKINVKKKVVKQIAL